MLLPTLSPEKLSLTDATRWSRRADTEAVDAPDAGNDRFQENLDRQIRDLRKNDQLNRDRLTRQDPDSREQADSAMDKTTTRVAVPQVTSDSANTDAHSRDLHSGDNACGDSNCAADGTDASENNIEQKTQTKEVLVNRKDPVHQDKKPGKDEDTGEEVLNVASVALQKQTIEVKKTASAEPTDSDSVPAQSAPDAAITALIDSRECGEKITIAWKKGEPVSSTAVLAKVTNRNGMQVKHSMGDTDALTALTDQSLNAGQAAGDNKKRQTSGNETTNNMASLIVDGLDKTSSTQDTKTPASDVSTWLNQLSLAMGTVNAPAKTPRSVRLGSTFFAGDSVLASQNAAVISSESTGRTASLATVATSTSTHVTLSPDFINRLSEQVMWLRHQQINIAELRLHPRDLGSVLVRIDSSGDNTSVNFVAAHHTVRDVLDQNMIKLRELFNDAGLNLVHVNVSSDSPSQQQSAMSGSGRSIDYQPSSLSGQPSNTVDSDEVAVQGTASGLSMHLVDFFA